LKGGRGDQTPKLITIYYDLENALLKKGDLLICEISFFPQISYHGKKTTPNPTMRAKEILQRYAQGERNFSGINLRGLSFQGANLSGADFSGADIRGTNFRGAILQGVNFASAKAGLQKRSVVGLLLLCLLLAVAAGVLFTLSGFFVGLIFDSSSRENQITGWVALFILLFTYGLIWRQGLGGGRP
jgi:hypothetical protein